MFFVLGEDPLFRDISLDTAQVKLDTTSPCRSLEASLDNTWSCMNVELKELAESTSNSIGSDDPPLKVQLDT